LEEALTSNYRISTKFQNQAENRKQIEDLEIWLAMQIIAMDSLQHSATKLKQRLKAKKNFTLKFQTKLEGESFWGMHYPN
jgi:hypothetical protein